MKIKLRFFNSLFVLFFLVAFTTKENKDVYFEIPKNWPKPNYDFKKNPLSALKIELGRKLFYDPILSKDNTISCASCHLQATGFTHVDHDLSHGIAGKIGTRNALSLQNLAWSTNFMWDGGINHLDLQALAPITSEVEMDENLETVLKKLQQSETYPKLVEAAFGTQNIQSKHLLLSLSQFMVTLVSANSKYDKVMRNEAEFTEMEKKGYALFKKNCASCHQEPLFTSSNFENNGLPLDPDLKDYGRMKITNNKMDSLKFKVPTLRNSAYTFPYMHDGRFETLTEVIKQYNTGIQKSNTLAKALQKPMNLSDNQRVELVAFLKILSDTEFLFNEKFSFKK